MKGLSKLAIEKLDTNQIYLGYPLEELFLLRKYKGVVSATEKGFFTDYFGVKTRFAYFSSPTKNLDNEEAVGDFPFPGDGVHAEALEYLAAIKAVETAQDRFVSVELGAGWGPWISLTGTLARKKAIKDITLVGVEADRARIALMRSHFSDNGLPVPDGDEWAIQGEIRVKMIHGGISGKPGQGHFAVKGLHDWGGRIVHANEDGIGSVFRRSQCSIPLFSVEDIIATFPLVDFMHFDIQGAELEAITHSIDCMTKKVRYIFVGTHSRAIEGRLLTLLLDKKWVLLNEKPCKFAYPLRPDQELVSMTTIDGGQMWVNPQLVRNFHGSVGGSSSVEIRSVNGTKTSDVLDLLFPPERTAVSGLSSPIVMSAPFTIPRAWEGFSIPEPWGTWTLGTRSRFFVEPDSSVKSDLQLVIDGHGLVTEKHRQHLEIQVNRHVVAEMTLTSASPSPRSIIIPRSILERDRSLEVVLCTPNAISPKELGINNDERVLGIAIKSISIYASQNMKER